MLHHVNMKRNDKFYGLYFILRFSFDSLLAILLIQYISTQPFSTTCKQHYKVISQGNGKFVTYIPNSLTTPSDTNKTQFAFWRREKFINQQWTVKFINQQWTKANDMPNKPLCHPMTSHKITQGGKETKQYTISGERSKWKTDAKLNTKPLMPGTRRCVAQLIPLNTCLSKGGM